MALVPGLALDALRARSSWTAPSSPASPWCWCSSCPCATSSTGTPTSRDKHLDAMAKLILVTSLVLTYFYVVRGLHRLVQRRPLRAGHRCSPRRPSSTRGPTGSCTSATAWRRSSSSGRRRAPTRVTLYVVSILVLIGMWFERFNIIVPGLGHDFYPYTWGTYYPTITDSTIIVGSLRLVLPPVPRLHPGDAVAVHRRGQGDAAAPAQARATGGTTSMATANVLGRLRPRGHDAARPSGSCGPRASRTSPSTRRCRWRRSRRRSRRSGRSARCGSSR